MTKKDPNQAIGIILLKIAEYKDMSLKSFDQNGLNQAIGIIFIEYHVISFP